MRYAEAINLLIELKEWMPVRISPDDEHRWTEAIDRILAMPENEGERLSRECDKLAAVVNE